MQTIRARLIEQKRMFRRVDGKRPEFTRRRETGGCMALAASVIETALLDATGATAKAQKNAQDLCTHYGRAEGALDWLRVTASSSCPGTFGWWCTLAGFDPVAILDAVEAEIGQTCRG